VRAGSRASYRAVVEVAGEPHLVRDELIGGGATARIEPRGSALASLVHLTDLHVTDTESPARFEFVNRYWGDPRYRELLTMQRPQETLNAHAIAAMLRTIGQLHTGPVTAGAIQLVAMTGDAVDNTQRNEFDNFVALMSGGQVRPDSGARGYEGVQLPGWPAEIFWKPDGAAGHNLFTDELGFPDMPGLLERAMEPFESPGLTVPWLPSYGNHEQVCQGVGVVTPALAQAMAGASKAIDMPSGIDPDRAVELFTDRPEVFLSSATRVVSADPRRRPISRAEYFEAFGRRESYYAHDEGALRYVVLDTVCDAGGADGTIDARQLRWLEASLDEARDRFVVVLSHHGYDTLSNPRGERRADELLDLLLRHPNVVLWLNGHIHANRVTPRPSPTGGGLWEVTTASIVDWPCQARVVELFDAGAGRLAIALTMLDHDGAALAGIHRELAGNVPFNDFDSWRTGTPADRNAVLLLPSPFELKS
jgi:3',5'-cyclic AMP phosphodiesterase CpdA